MALHGDVVAALHSAVVAGFFLLLFLAVAEEALVFSRSLLSLSLALFANSNAFLFRYGRFIFSFWFLRRDLQIIQNFGIPDKGDNNLRETMGKRRTGTNVDGDEEKEEEEESRKAVLEGVVSDEESAVEVKVIGQVLKRSGGKGKVERKHYQAFEVDGCRYDVVSFS